MFSNITKEEGIALHSLRNDDSCIALTADKLVALVIIDKDMFMEKCMALLHDEVYHGYRDQTKSTHSKVLKQLLDLSNGLKFKDQYMKLCPPGDNSPPARTHGLSKIHKTNIPHRPIVSACGTSTYK